MESIDGLEWNERDACRVATDAGEGESQAGNKNGPGGERKKRQKKRCRWRKRDRMLGWIERASDRGGVCQVVVPECHNNKPILLPIFDPVATH